MYSDCTRSGTLSLELFWSKRARLRLSFLSCLVRARFSFAKARRCSCRREISVWPRSTPRACATICRITSVASSPSAGASAAPAAGGAAAAAAGAASASRAGLSAILGAAPRRGRWEEQ